MADPRLPTTITISINEQGEIGLTAQNVNLLVALGLLEAAKDILLTQVKQKAQAVTVPTLLPPGGPYL